VRQTEAVLGTGSKEVLSVEDELRGFARRSIFAVRPIAAGETLTRENIVVLRNGTNAPGLPPSEYPALIGRKAACMIPAGTGITTAMVGDEAPLS
jgi:N-acetylneuraminate synthase